MDGEVGPVEQRDERRRASGVVVVRRRRAAWPSLSSSFVPSDWASLPALTRWKSGVGTSRSWRALVARSPSRTIAWASSPNGSRCCGLVVRVLRSVSWSVHSWSETMRLPRLLDELLAELDRLGEDDLLLGGQQRDLADLLEVHPDRVVDPDHVGADAPRAPRRSAPRPPSGRACAGASAGRRASRVGRRPRSTTSTVDLGVGLRLGGLGGRGRASSSSSSSSSSASGDGRGRPRAGAVPASFASSMSALARRGRDRTASTSCLSSGSAWRTSDGACRVSVCWRSVLVAAGTAGRARSRVWSRRRSSDRRCSLIWRRSSIRRSIGVARRRRAPPRPSGRRVVVAALARADRPRARASGARPRRRAAVARSRVRARLAMTRLGRAPRLSRRAPSRSADSSNGGRTPWSSGARASTIARNSSRASVLGSWSGPSSSRTAQLLLGDEQQEPQQLLLDRA